MSLPLATPFPPMEARLVDEAGKSIVELPLDQRRPRLEQFAKTYFNGAGGTLKLSPATTDLKTAKEWFKKVGGDLDGIIAKRRDCEYRSAERDGMQKVKSSRTADCVIGGFRFAEKKKVIGSLLLGLYDDAGLLHHVGFCSGLKAGERERLTPKLERLIKPPGFTGNAPGGPSRWSTKRSAEWQPLDPKLVV